MNDLDARIREALRAATDRIQEQDLRPAHAPQSSTVRSRGRVLRWTPPMLAAVAVIAVVVVTSLALSGSPSASRLPQPAGPGTGTASPTTSPPNTQASTPAPTTVSPTPAPGADNAACYFADACPTGSLSSFYEPLWPFDSYAQARQWQKIDGPDGHQPWHSDAAATALFFTENYLGFTDITLVTTTQVGADQAHVGVGYRDPSGSKRTSAVLHLIRYEKTLGETDAGWEVVGSDDTSFSLEQPAYDSVVSSPMTVGGHITGTDENISVAVRTSDGAVDRITPFPAGGDNAPWSATVPFSEHGVLTIVASTGGHLIQHERFAIQGVHTAS